MLFTKNQLLQQESSITFPPKKGFSQSSRKEAALPGTTDAQEDLCKATTPAMKRGLWDPQKHPTSKPNGNDQHPAPLHLCQGITDHGELVGSHRTPRGHNLSTALKPPPPP